jgi:hypothetical protein
MCFVNGIGTHDSDPHENEILIMMMTKNLIVTMILISVIKKWAQIGQQMYSIITISKFHLKMCREPKAQALRGGQLVGL